MNGQLPTGVRSLRSHARAIAIAIAVCVLAVTTVSPARAQEDGELVEGDYVGELFLVASVTGSADGVTAFYSADYEGDVSFSVDEVGQIAAGEWNWTGSGQIDVSSDEGSISQDYVGSGQIVGGGTSITLIGSNTTNGSLSGGGITMSLGSVRSEVRIPDLPVTAAGCDGVEAAFDVPIQALIQEAGWDGPASGLITARRVVEYSEGLQRQIDGHTSAVEGWSAGAQAAGVIDVPVAIGLLAIARSLMEQQLIENPCLERYGPGTVHFDTVGRIASAVLFVLESGDITGRTIHDAGLLVPLFADHPEVVDVIEQARSEAAIEVIERDFRIEDDEPVEYVGDDPDDTTQAILSSALTTAGTIAGRYAPEPLLGVLRSAE